MFCTQCGSQVADTARFCGRCGTPLTQPVQPAPVAYPAVQTAPVVAPLVMLAPASTSRPWLWILGGGAVLVLMVLFLGLPLLALSTMDHVVQTHLEALRQDKVAEAYTHTSANFRQNIPDGAFLIMAKTIMPTLRSSQFVVMEHSMDGKRGLVRGALVDRSNNASAVDFHLVMEESGWKIDVIDLNPKNPPRPDAEE